MSGTSCDGLDLAYCSFYKTIKWNYKIIQVKTYAYTKEWVTRLHDAGNFNARDFLLFHKEYGRFIGQNINNFLGEYRLPSPDLISSHGHTIFHQPEIKFNFQLGEGNIIAGETGITTISDFRTLDIANGGQGAPLVPIGDKYLFGNFNFCLNLGGFANITYSINQQPKAFDICSCNLIANYLSQKKGSDFDEKGELGRNGKINNDLLKELNSIEYFSKEPPKSLGREWFSSVFLPIVEKYNIQLEDKLRTVYEHIAYQITKIIKTKQKSSVFVTGGGAYNDFLIELIKQKTENEIIVPSSEFIEYKEAIIFGFLGILRFRNEINCLASVTGAKTDSSTGNIVYVK
jgi:anhydro-N-acetylmuramic acid kinase